jgi:sugar/nucleoside kinase (ribokinase family)
VIVVVGSPLVVVAEGGLGAGGTAVGVARAAAAAGGEVQVVGKVGEDPAGDAVLLDLAAARIGHVAILRDPSRATPAVAPIDEEADLFGEGDGELTAHDEPATTDRASEPGAAQAAGRSAAAHAALPLDPGDIELALRYLPDYRVLVVAEPLADATLAVALAAASWNGAATVVIVPAGSPQPAGAEGATVIEAPADDPDDAFAGIVGAYAAAIDRGEEPAEAFATASSSLGASAVLD